MRNILQYPVTKAEKLDALDQATGLLEAEIGDRIGGISIYALRLVRQHIESLPDDEA
jgi:hypothetical protein